MKCWKCSKEQEAPSSNKLAFRAECAFCMAWLHCCKNCKNYKPGLPNDCAIPGTEYIADREAMNYCEDFSLKGTGPDNKIDNELLKKKFEDLFGP